MNKANSLKQHLLAAVPELHGNPDKLLVFIDQGRARTTVVEGLSFEYGYTLNAILTDFAGHPDAVAVPLLAWLLINQPDLMQNIEKMKEVLKKHGIQYEVEDVTSQVVSDALPIEDLSGEDLLEKFDPEYVREA